MVSDKALKHLEKFDKRLQRKIVDVLEKFQISPFIGGIDIKKLKGTQNCFRVSEGKLLESLI